MKPMSRRRLPRSPVEWTSACAARRLLRPDAAADDEDQQRGARDDAEPAELHQAEDHRLAERAPVGGRVDRGQAGDRDRRDGREGGRREGRGARRGGGRAEAEEGGPDDDRRREGADDDLRGPEGERPRGRPEDPARQRAQTLSSPTVLPPEEPELAAAGFSAAFPSPPEDPLLDAALAGARAARVVAGAAALAAVVGVVEARALEVDGGREEHLAHLAAAHLALGERVVGHALGHLELVPAVVAAILIDRHESTSLGRSVVRRAGV